MRPDLFTGLQKPQNILLYSPPGTGKTLLARPVARESQSNVFVVTASSLMSKWIGHADKLVNKCLFQVAQELAPSIMFIDKMDALLSAQKVEGEHKASCRLKSEFMVQMDEIVQQQQSNNTANILLLACTNFPWDVDLAVIHPFPLIVLEP
jgi:SpoVK/Ycf46/Vps4 family AAA+-type ATPase